MLLKKYIFYKNIKICVSPFTFQIHQKKCLWLKKLKMLCRRHMLLVILNMKKLQKTNQQGFRVKKVIKRKSDKLYVKWEGYGNSSAAGLI